MVYFGELEKKPIAELRTSAAAVCPQGDRLVAGGPDHVGLYQSLLGFLALPSTALYYRSEYCQLYIIRFVKLSNILEQ